MRTKNLDSIINLLLELASGNLTAKGKVSSRNDDYDAIISGINILTEELRHTTVSKDYLSSIYRGIVDMLFILNKKGMIMEMNEAALSTINIKPENMIGKPFQNLFLHPNLFKDIFLDLKSTGYHYNIENSLFNKDGIEISVSCTAAAIKDKINNVIGYLIIAKDISSIKKTEENLRLKNKELDTFLYKAAHDLKSPVTSIQGLLNIANMEIKDKDAMRYFDLIRTCANKLENILTTLKETVELDISSLGLEKVSLNSIVGSILSEVQNAPYYDASIKVTQDIYQPFPIYTKTKSISFAITQILSNAYKFQKGNGKGIIDIKVEQKKNTTIITISDNGIGIHRDYVSKIFDMFYKANNKHEGAGLGLYAAQSIIGKIDGKIEVDSQVNKGSIFTITFKSIFDNYNLNPNYK